MFTRLLTDGSRHPGMIGYWDGTTLRHPPSSRVGKGQKSTVQHNAWAI
jgi:hypothetical protein